MNLKKILYLAACILLFAAGFVEEGAAQGRDRVIKTVSSRPLNQPPTPSQVHISSNKTPTLSTPTKNSVTSRPVLTNKIEVVPPPPSLVKKTGDSDPVKAMVKATVAGSAYSSAVSGGMMSKIQSMIGIPYRYGSTGPSRYDCSGFVWAVFNAAGIDFTRTSARVLWNAYEPVSGDERFKFGTLVFFNRLGHVGIVADENGFYHASSSKGITYSKFDGYWGKRIVGFRRIPMTASVVAAK